MLYEGVYERLLWGSEELGRGEAGDWGQAAGAGENSQRNSRGTGFNGVLSSSGLLMPGPGPGTEWRPMMLSEEKDG